MDLRNCPRCGKLFAYDGNHKLCNVCREDEEYLFQRVKDYLWDNPKASIEEVHKATEVEREMIIKFVREDRLIAEGLELEFSIECERCGAPIEHGRFCNDCQQELVQGFSDDSAGEKNNNQGQAEKKIKGKMFTKDRLNKRRRR